MVSTKQKIAKIFKEDAEIAEDMINEQLKKDRQRKIDWSKLLHLFSIHTYSEQIREYEGYKVVKCELCGKLKITRKEARDTSVVGCLCGLLLGGYSSLIGIAELIRRLFLGTTPIINIIVPLLSIPIFLYALKWIIERSRMA